MLRTHTCGELTIKDVGKKVILAGWIDRIRDLGGVKFLMLRDRYGQTQIILSQNCQINLRRESVVQIEGVVQKRPEETINKDLLTGEIEVFAEKVNVFSSPEKDLPFYPGETKLPAEEIRLKYRYIDLRRKEVSDRIITRHKVTQCIRNYLSKNGFIEVETPFLTKSTPEGARDFLVPSRLKPGTFYALPQSPQLFKQLLMIGGIDRYFQVVRCFRDEDLRADRQPEFTQIDIEMSFNTMDDVLEITEGMIKHLFKEVLQVDLPGKLDRLTYNECMNKYGSDKPDRRIGMEFFDLSKHFKTCEYHAINAELSSGGVVKGFVVRDFANKMSRKLADELNEIAKSLGGGGILWFSFDSPESIKGAGAKYLQKNYNSVAKELSINYNDVCVLSAGKIDIVNTVLGEVRKILGERYFSDLRKGFDIFWVTDFPMFEYSEEENRFVAQHHPFTMPNLDDLKKYKNSDLSKIRAQSYDIVINGFEVGSGSIRIHDAELQREIFKLMRLTEEEVKLKFGFLLEAFQYGAPPHGGIALGLDRLTAIICGVPTIREVIAFPKTSSGICPLTGAPDVVNQKQLDELKIILGGDHCE
ncbi:MULTISPECIES: aspartate--tRNA ligase [Pseudothermotoga]|jgi:aspartyl-tRNA synthetase|uniref:Aspartate--tRNA ligase n=3 Tax=Pseudothermotoga TaxID=1643951 RepID=SYD_PSELT|nr:MULTISPECIES: aspartate--tRNA ligase [Pseudothermotoga]A8F7R7.1 RecName: Full=Aspartate--tRNA ligase; AltName: Full=Aspartyl-tRNA synthetase; Short=AspRS [Pseudothermotoga lettingae TMO]ABV34201.1 aspartyl-tRNA synthetase [Pseudothermotoga lettingae TMO]KUK21141.1 MAG: Aspartate--tRNA ligase [Pseudothermotoga lettingae]MDI3494473.1 aspartyl-tRNA synthetase [Pseudothermotoga sp.]MDK2884807.1 aspartyl-tRNA synthetase [Pseudothermotoga sp.]GLI48855.1 aspartate--tRNA(Asp/Asn) ligase [Pseudothe